MKKRIARIGSVLFLLVLFAPILMADFHHIEKTAKSDPACPACRVQQSTLMASAFTVFLVPELTALAFVEQPCVPAEIDSYSLLRSPRAPPQA